jgi:hypothetical protein
MFATPRKVLDSTALLNFRNLVRCRPSRLYIIVDLKQCSITNQISLPLLAVWRRLLRMAFSSKLLQADNRLVVTGSV